MSTYWGYFCRTCNQETDTWLNHGEDRLIELYRLAPEFNLVLNKAKHNKIEVLFLGIDNEDDPLEWLKIHFRHDVCLLNEYGKTLNIDNSG